MESFQPSSPLDKYALKKLLIVSIICLIFMIGEIVGGLLANSLAIATDAAHLLTDLSSFIISMASIYLAAKSPSSRLNWGWHRAEVLGALTSLIFIWIVTGILVYMAVLRVLNQNYEIDAIAMLVTAAIGLAFNVLMAFVLHSGGHTHGGYTHSHSHSHSNSLVHSHSHSNNYHACTTINSNETPHGHSLEEEQSDDVPLIINDNRANHKSKLNINIRAAFIHVLGDILQSIGVLIAAYIIYYQPAYKIADPICTFVFSLLVIGTTIPILRDTILVLMEATPRGFNRIALYNEISGLTGIKSIKLLRIWSLTVGRIAGTVHVILDSAESDQLTIVSNIEEILVKYDVQHTSIQIDF